MAPQADEYQSLSAALRRAGVLAEVAEVHGSLCSVLCLSGSRGAQAWRRDILDNTQQENAQVASSRAVLKQLELQTWAAFNGSGINFMPLLPHEDEDLPQRVDALAHWCQGFLYGVSLSGITQASETQALGAAHFDELVGDLAEIARAGLAADDDLVEADFAYAELVEFVRAGVQLVFEELEAFRGQHPPSTQALH